MSKKYSIAKKKTQKTIRKNITKTTNIKKEPQNIPITPLPSRINRLLYILIALLIPAIIFFSGLFILNNAAQSSLSSQSYSKTHIIPNTNANNPNVTIEKKQMQPTTKIANNANAFLPTNQVTHTTHYQYNGMGNLIGKTVDGVETNFALDTTNG